MNLYTIRFLLRTPIEFTEAEAAAQIATAVSHHLGKAGIDVVGPVLVTRLPDTATQGHSNHERKTTMKQQARRPITCLTCGTQCDAEGICPVCSAVEEAEEAVRAATLGVIPSTYRPEERKALDDAYAALAEANAAWLDSCRKCGAPIARGDLDREACVDEGEGPEWKVFVYCSRRCMEAR